MYALLANLFYRPPNAILIKNIIAAGAVYDGGDTPLADAWVQLAAAASAAELGALQDAYAALFVSPGEAPVILHSSWYLTGFLHEKPLAELRQALIKLGFARNDDVSEPEDHIAALCDVMRLLIADGRPIAVQQEFFTRFIGPWCERYTDRLTQAAIEVPGADFYRCVGQFARAFWDVEKLAFEMDG